MKTSPFLLLLILAPLTRSGVVTYEGDVFPDLVGWQRLGTFDADRWIEHGWFCHFLELGVWDPPPYGELDVYRRALADYAGAETFFIEWRVMTDAPASILEDSGIPVSVSAAGTTVAGYQFIITDARVEVIRNNFLPIIFVDIEPGVPHTYRLELEEAPNEPDSLYAWYIDGAPIDAGLAVGPYPTDSSVLLWGARHYMFENTTCWQYLRYGTIPIDGSGDYDSNGNLDRFDFYFFHECLSADAPGDDAGPGCRFADMDSDTDVDLHDFALLQNAFTGTE